MDVTAAARLAENRDLCFRADEKGGPFDIDGETADQMLGAPQNVNGRPNSDVLKPWANAKDLVGRQRGMWIIDFYGMKGGTAAAYERPFEYLATQIERERQEQLPRAKSRRSQESTGGCTDAPAQK